MNAGSWRRLGTHRTMAREMRVLVCQGSQLRSWQRWRCPLLTCDPRMSLKKQDDPAWSQVLRMQLAALHHFADAFAAPRASLTSRVLGCVWIVAKVHLTKILVMTQRLVFVWMVAIFLACQ